MNKTISFTFNSSNDFMRNLLKIAEDEECFCMLNSNNYSSKNGAHELLVGWGGNNSIEADNFESLKIFTNDNDWTMGYLSYDLKNDTEKLASHNEDLIGAPKSFFFKPTVLVKTNGNSCEITHDESLLEVDSLVDYLCSIPDEEIKPITGLKIKTKETYQQYIQAVSEIKKHIKQGNIYEANYCTEFYAENCLINPADLFITLNKISPAPFSAFVKNKNHVAISASPERFVQRKKNKIISQPIKGTARRSENKQQDNEIRAALRDSEKDRSENIMIVDLVRNDLSKYAINNSVTVDELCEVYSFPHVHQMISTISAEVSTSTNNIDIIKRLFPPGSMTGAPKVKAMKLMEHYEKTKRGIYSGAIGYFDNEGGFDFNVVIRSIIYNSDNNYLSFMVGGAITDNSIPEVEYEECLIKAQAIFQALGVAKKIATTHA